MNYYLCGLHVHPSYSYWLHSIFSQQITTVHKRPPPLRKLLKSSPMKNIGTIRNFVQKVLIHTRENRRLLFRIPGKHTYYVQWYFSAMNGFRTFGVFSLFLSLSPMTPLARLSTVHGEKKKEKTRGCKISVLWSRLLSKRQKINCNCFIDQREERKVLSR